MEKVDLLSSWLTSPGMVFELLLSPRLERAKSEIWNGIHWRYGLSSTYVLKFVLCCHQFIYSLSVIIM
jgi:hypothetical protein